ncbi:unnamed protein product [Ceutorhynchus assimilis]|uniref:Uncharacterized protein n=1 Tax=Ceutorhynchus assimilis TaxID=467358 RepID=A0A9N9QLG6_9CUCU|nr:unnamed protein product [Ceutorhynchus assimilis]
MVCWNLDHQLHLQESHQKWPFLVLPNILHSILHQKKVHNMGELLSARYSISPILTQIEEKTTYETCR